MKILGNKVDQDYQQYDTIEFAASDLELIPKALNRTALVAVNARKTVASAKTAHLKSLFWDRLLLHQLLAEST